MSLPHEAKQELERFIQKGEKIHAIEHLMNRYGFSGEESKAIVSALEQQATSPSANPAVSRDDRPLDAAAGNRVIDRQQFFSNPHRRYARTLPGGGKLVVAIFLIVGSIFLIIAGYTYFNQLSSLKKSDLVTGKVVRMQINSEGLSSPIIAYAWEGKDWIYASRTYSKPAAYEVDELVPIYVNREDPSEVTVDTFSDRWLLLTIFAGMGVIFVTLALLIAYLGRRTTG